MSAPLSLDPIRAAWSRRKWLAIPIFLFPLAASVTLILAMPTIYRSAATIIIERQQVPEAFVRATVTDEIEMRLQAISEQALSRSRLQGLITRFDLYPEFRARESTEQIIERVRQDIKIQPSTVLMASSRGAGLVAFSVSFRGPDPGTVAAVANEVASFFVDENMRARERQATGTTEFLEVELAQTKQRLDEQERRMSEFNRRNLGELPSQMTANLATLESLNTQLRLNADSQTRATERRGVLAGLLAEQTTLIRAGLQANGRQAPVDPVAARLGELRQWLAFSRARLHETHPTIVRLRAEIAELEKQLGAGSVDSAEKPGEEATRAADAAILQNPQVVRLREQVGEVDIQLRALKIQEQQLVKDIATYRARVENAPRVEQELQEFSRDHGSTKELYQSLLKRYEESRLAESMEQRQKGEQFRLLDPAVAAREVAAPRRSRLLLMTVALFGGLAAGVVMLAEKLDTSFHTVDAVRGFTRIPVLASIPRIVTDRDRHRGRWWGGLGAASGAAGLALVVLICYAVAHGNERLVRLLVQG